MTDLAFDFSTRKWKNVNKEYAHEELKFISSVVPEGNDCQLNLDDVIVFLRDWLNKEKLSMQLLSSDESRDPRTKFGLVPDRSVDPLSRI